MANEQEPVETETVIEKVSEGECRETGEETPPLRWRPAAEPTCCGSGCDDCPF
jgi:hypothetical protein